MHEAETPPPWQLLLTRRADLSATPAPRKCPCLRPNVTALASRRGPLAAAHPSMAVFLQRARTVPAAGSVEITCGAAQQQMRKGAGMCARKQDAQRDALQSPCRRSIRRPLRPQPSRTAALVRGAAASRPAKATDSAAPPHLHDDGAVGAQDGAAGLQVVRELLVAGGLEALRVGCVW